MIIKTVQNALSNAWPMLVIFLSIIIIVRFAYLLINHKKMVFYEEIITLCFLIYVLMLFEFLTSTETGTHGLNLVPFTEITRYRFGSSLFIYNVIGNVVLFMPFGYFVAYYCKVKNVFPIFIIATFTSFIIELVQLKIGRAFDIDDIILNVLGGIIGYLIYAIFMSLKKHLPNIFKTETFYNILAIVLVIVLCYGFYHFIGFGWF